MKTVIYYFSATGNSLIIANDLARELGDTDVVAMAKALDKPINTPYDRVGIVFPVYMFGLPLVVARFLRNLKVQNDTYVFAVANFGGLPGRALMLTRNILKERGILTLEYSNLKLKKLFEILLDVAFEISGADIGSIMFFDKSSDAFTIRVSRGIPDEIATNTRVKVGDGISGTVAKEGEPILVDNTTRDNRIKRYLTRPYISSSMVLPLKSADTVILFVSNAQLTFVLFSIHIPNHGAYVTF